MSRAAPAVLALALLPFLLGNLPPDCDRSGLIGTVLERQVRAERSLDDATALPHAFRYRVRTDQPLAWYGTDLVTVDSDQHDLPVGSRWIFVLTSTIDKDYMDHRLPEAFFVGDCDVRAVPPRRPPAHGCGHCSIALPGAAPATAALVAAVLVLLTRRRRA